MKGGRMIKLVMVWFLTWGVVTMIGAQPPGVNRQSTLVSVSGRIVDASTGERLAGVAVVLRKKFNSQQRFWGFSNAQGYFKINALPGRYHLTVRMMGYRDTAWDIVVPSEEIFLGEIVLTPATLQLQEVEVAESAYREAVDRLEILVTDQMRKGTNSARQLMEKIPGVEYDPFSDNIRVDNKENVLLLVNGMEKSDEYIKNIDPLRIRKIEIYRDPTGRYGLEGYSAVINILLRDDYVGYNVSYSSLMAFSTSRRYSPTLVPFQFHRFSTTRALGRFSIYGNFGYVHPNSGRIRKEVIRRDDGSEWLRIPPLSQSFNTFFEMEGYRFSGGVDYFPVAEDMWSIEFQRRGMIIPSQSTTQTLSVDSRFPDDSLLITTTNSSRSGSYRIHLFTNLAINPNNRLNSSLNLRRGRSHSISEYSESGSRLYRQEDAYSDDRSFKGYVEWEHSFNPIWQLLLGYTYNYREDFGIYSANTSIDTYRVAMIDTSYLNILNRHQAYGYVTFRLGKWTVKGGSAMESFTLHTDGGSITFTMPQPSLDVMWKFHRILSLRWKYRSELRYPSQQELSNFRRMIDRYTFQEGNPSLQPYTIHRASMQLGAMGGRARIEPYVRFTRSYIAEALFVQNDTLIYRPENSGKYFRYGMEASLPIPLGKKVFMMLSGDVYAEQLTTLDGNVRNVADFTSFVMLIYRFHSPFSVGIMQMNHMGKRVTSNGYRLGTGRHSDLTLLFLRGTFWQDRLTASLSYVTDFRMPWIDYTTITYSESPSLTRTVETYIPTVRQVISLRLSLVLNKGQVKKARRDDQEMPEGGFMF